MLKERLESKRNRYFSSRPPLGPLMLKLWELLVLVVVSGFVVVVVAGDGVVVVVAV
jgi:hypothetical protein